MSCFTDPKLQSLMDLNIWTQITFPGYRYHHPKFKLDFNFNDAYGFFLNDCYFIRYPVRSPGFLSYPPVCYFLWLEARESWGLVTDLESYLDIVPDGIKQKLLYHLDLLC